MYFAWEIVQMPGYVVPDSSLLRVAGCVAATVGDVAIVLGLWWIATIAFRDAHWFEPPRLSRYALVVMVAVVVNIAIEWLAVGILGVWSYSPHQPVVPWLGAGLLAVLQALVLPPLTFYALARWERRSPAAPRR
ncbi:MAG: hypothetical protein ACREKH_21855 [Candidatus Rokuibacteriota bacterium]